MQPLLGPEIAADPYPVYQRLRATQPVYYYEPERRWYITSHAAAEAVLHHDRLSSVGVEGLRAKMAAPELEPMLATMAAGMVHKDGKDHGRMRGLVSKAFTPRAVAALAPRIQAIADQLLDAAEARGRLDLMADFADHLPMVVIAELLGLPAADEAMLKHWSELIASISGAPTADGFAHAAAAHHELTTYLGAIIADRRRQPADDLLSALVQVQVEGERLSEAELFSIAHLLMVAGNETTASLIGVGTWALLQQPEQWRRLLTEPALVPSAVEELLRFVTPIQFKLHPLVANEDLRFDAVTIPRGAFVTVVLGAVNRDPAVFPDPDKLDVTRDPNPHMAFSAGPHFCLGAPLARLEARIVFETLLRRFPTLRRADGPVHFRPYPNFRTLESLPLLLR